MTVNHLANNSCPASSTFANIAHLIIPMKSSNLSVTSTLKMSSAEVGTAQRYQKHFIPLESNPEVFTELIHKLGVAESLCFQDVFSLDDPGLLALIPRPVYALILVFPTSPAYEDKVEREDAGLEEYRQSGTDEEIMFFRQTINNACGLYAILHAVCNGDARKKMSMMHCNCSL